MKRSYVIKIKNGKRPYEFHTVAKSEADAIRIMRKFHKGRHIESVELWMP